MGALQGVQEGLSTKRPPYFNAETSRTRQKRDDQHLMVKTESEEIMAQADFEEEDVNMRLIPAQCDIKRNCQVGFFRPQHVLIRLSLMEDFVNLLLKGAHYIKAKDGLSYQMRPLIYESTFKIDEEPSQVMA